MTLATFIQENTQPIIREWENFARSLIPSSSEMTPLALRNHIERILAFIISDMESPQTGAEQIQKSHGEGAQKNKVKPSAAETHAALRLAGGFDMDQMVAEYRALRASIIKLWSAENKECSITDIQDLTRFNEAVDQAMSESISHYARKLTDSKDIFLGILTHDLRNPLTTILMSAQLVPQIGDLNEKQNVLVEQIIDSSARIDEIVTHLLDITRARFGSGLPVLRSPIDMAFIGRQLVDEAQTAHPDRKFVLDISGDTEGDWDKARVGQVFSNLIGNAVQYSFKNTPVSITIKGDSEEVILSVHNEGLPIPANKIARIFDSLVRVTAADKDHDRGQTTNLGLGLFYYQGDYSGPWRHTRRDLDGEGRNNFYRAFPARAACRQESNSCFSNGKRFRSALRQEINMPIEKNFSSKRFPIVCVGGSAGSLEAYIALLKNLPDDMGVAIVIVNHITTMPTMLHEILPRYTKMPVKLITERLIVKPNHVFIIPANRDLHVLEGEFRLEPISKPHGWPDVITVFLNSLAQYWKGRLVAVIVSGLDGDGAAALSAIKKVGGITIAQKPDTASSPGMPESAIKSGNIDLILPANEIAQELIRIAQACKTEAA